MARKDPGASGKTISYTTLLTVTALFLGILTSIFWFSSQTISKVAYFRLISTTTASLSGDIPNIAHSLGIMHNPEVAENSDDYRLAVQELVSSRQRMNLAIEGLGNGGRETFVAWNENKLKVPKAPTEVSRLEAEELAKIWSAYDMHIRRFFDVNASYARMPGATDPGQQMFLRQYTAQIPKMRELIRSIDQEGRKTSAVYSKNATRLQYAGIALSGVYFLLLWGWFVRSLKKADTVVEAARRETGEIMSTVREGLFLVDDDLSIGSQHSHALEELLDQGDVGGASLQEVLSNLLPEEDVETTTDFIEQLFNPHVNENLVTDLNPLKRVMVRRYDRKSGLRRERYLDFGFKRVREGDVIKRILVTVNDVTNEVLLEKQFEQEQEQNERQMGLFAAVVNSDADMLRSFVSDAREGLIKINGLVKTPGQTEREMRQSLSTLKREAHSVKGESSAMKMGLFVDLSAQLEDKLNKMSTQSKLSAKDFKSASAIVDELMGLQQNLESLLSKLAHIAGNVVTRKPDALKNYLDSFCKDIARRNAKEIQLEVLGLDDYDLPREKKHAVRDIVTQMLRNAVVHGVERPGIREAAGKNRPGRIAICLQSKGKGMLTLSVEDDGSGIDFEKLRSSLVKIGLRTAEQAKQMTKKQLARAMFELGATTADRAGEDAGRGLGMDVIKDRVRELEGKMNFATSWGKGTKFVVTFPQA